METTLVRPYTPVRQPLGALGKLTGVTLVSIAGALAYVQLSIVGQFDPQLTTFAVIMLVVAAMIGRGWRWAPLVGAALSAMVVVGNRTAVIYDLQRPENLHLFTFMVVAVALAVVGTVAGISATVQNYRRTEPRTPRIMAPALVGLVGLCLGAVLVGVLSRPASTGVSPEVLASLPALTTPDLRFDQTTLEAQVGETVALRLDNPHVAPHSFDIDALNVHVPVAAGESGLVLFKPTQAGTYTFYCQVPGHREVGMEGVLIVK